MEKRTQKLVISALLVALSFVGANIKIFGTIAFDSLPGFLAALILGPVYGAAIGLLGHLCSAMTSGFPLTVPMHLIVSATMAMTMLGFGFTHRALKDCAPRMANFAITGVVGVILNGPVSLAFLMGTLAVIAGKEAAMGLLALLPVLVLAAAANVVISIMLFIALERVWNKP